MTSFTIHSNASTLFPDTNNQGFFLSTFLDEIPGSSAFIVCGLAARIFVPALSVPFFGIGVSLLTTGLVLKFLDRYNKKALINLTLETRNFNKKYPKLQLISFIFSLCVSLLNPVPGLLTGITVGSFGALMANVENYRLKQKESREKSNDQLVDY